MDMQAKKLNLIDWLVNLEDENLLDKLADIKNEETSDWYDDLPKEARTSIQRGLEDVKQGRISSHEEVMARMKKKYDFLK